MWPTGSFLLRSSQGEELNLNPGPGYYVPVSKLAGTFFFLLLSVGALVCYPNRSPSAASDPAAHSDEFRLSPSLTKPSIVVKKAQRQLLLFSDSRLVRTYRIGLGLNPVGDKVRAGDRRTPEGSFYIFTRNPRSAFYLSLGLSYPNAEHAQRGLRNGLITRGQYDRIIDALKRKGTPPQNTALGGDIYIHGNGSRSDWTWGCVALDDAEMRGLYHAAEVGTPVTIEP